VPFFCSIEERERHVVDYKCNSIVPVAYCKKGAGRSFEIMVNFNIFGSSITEFCKAALESTSCSGASKYLLVGLLNCGLVGVVVQQPLP
jgi:hypothetical protein